MQQVPKPKQKSLIKQDVSHISTLPGSLVTPAAKIKDKVKASPEKARKNEFDMLEQKRDLYVSQVDKIKQEFGMR